MSQPNASQPSANQPGTGQPRVNQPGTEGRPGMGMTGFVRPEATMHVRNEVLSADQLSGLESALVILRRGPFAVLTGAGLSTDSGIPDYRSPNSPPRNPVTYQEFVRDDTLRRRYWARNQVGWRHMHHAEPNAGHFAVARMEQRGVLTGLITQNVDRLHEAAGAHNAVDLHGRFDSVICLQCGTMRSRDNMAALIDEANPGFLEEADALGGIQMNPDADAEITDAELIDGFTIPPCPVCGGMLKPDFVFFGENVPKDRVERSFDMLAQGAALLVAGSSLTVMSGLRFARKAAKEGQPVVIINRGVTRGDDLADLKLDAGVSPSLTWLAERLG